jgi:RNA polymerase sigma-70 factor (ECF subfamily)
VLPVDYGPPSDPHDALAPPLTETVWLDPFPDEGIPDGHASPDARYEQRESVELAFIAALQHLPERQRAVLLLRDVLGFAPAEIAVALDATPAAVYSTLQRAHAAVEERLPARSQQATLRTIGDERLRALVERFVRAWEDADVATITAMLTADATLAMPPRPNWYRGAAAIGAFLAKGPLSAPRWRHLPARANGQLAFGVYFSDGEPAYRGQVIHVLTLDDDARIAAMTAFHGAGTFARFGLPPEIRRDSRTIPT